MSTRDTTLPREVSALVHHVELNRAGWWDKTLNRLVLAAVWLADRNPDQAQILDALQGTFALTVQPQKLAQAIESLKAEDCLVEVSSGAYRIPDQARREFDREIAEAEQAETNAREHFLSLVAGSCPELDACAVWDAFDKKVLVPMVRDTGANTYRLIAGEAQTPDGTHAENFLTAFGAAHRVALKAIVARFLDPKNAAVRDYITRMLHAHFCVEASGVSDATLEKLKTITAKPLRLQLFVDTNFLFSLLGLHENPSNASASELKELLATLKSNPVVELFITSRTISEAKHAIGAAKAQVSGVPQSGNFTQAALRVGMSGMSERFFAERRQRKGLLTADDWFDPYLKNFVPLARAAGVELYNASLDEFGTRQDVVDDIHLVMDYEKDKFPKERRKSYGKVAHDMVLWHLVKDKRPAYVESPVDAQQWILTVDFRLMGFDQHKLRGSGSNVPLCLHPTSLIQLLQFWVPRTQEFEEAVLGGMRLPFLFQEFDAKAERISLAIIKKIGRFVGSEEIPEDTLVDVALNDALRSRIDQGQPEEEEIKLVRDALVEEMRMRAEKEKARVEELKATVKAKNAALADSREERQAKNAEIRELQARLTEEEAKSRAAGEALSSLSDKQIKLESSLARMVDEKKVRRALFAYLGLLVPVIGLSLLAGWLAKYLPLWGDVVLTVLVQCAAGVAVFVLAHLCLELALGRDSRMQRLWPFRKLQQFRRVLWSLVVVIILGTAGSLLANRIQSRMESQTPKEQPTPTTMPSDSGAGGVVEE